MAHRLRFGIFLAPFHKPGINPTLALQSDLELIQWLDRCGYDEAWCGEHHSAGTEISASPEILMAVAAERTRHIKLGSGVVSLSYHNPLWVAERIVLLDHLTRGRVMFGVGPGSLPTDGAMIGVKQADTRRLLEDSLGVIMRLLRGNEPVNFKNERWELVDARLHLRPYSNPLFDVAVAAVASPTGPRLAARHGVGLLSVGATTAAGFDALALHWDVMEDQAKVHNTQCRPLKMASGRPVSRRRNDRAGLPRRRIWHRTLVPVFPGCSRLPADGGSREQRQRDDLVHQRFRFRRDRHAGHGHRAD